MFPSPRGHLWHEGNFGRAWRRLRALAATEGVRPLSFHSTRHTFITWALEAGTATKHVSERVGASQVVVETSYSHLIEGAPVNLDFVDGTQLAHRRRTAIAKWPE